MLNELETTTDYCKHQHNTADLAGFAQFVLQRGHKLIALFTAGTQDGKKIQLMVENTSLLIINNLYLLNLQKHIHQHRLKKHIWTTSVRINEAIKFAHQLSLNRSNTHMQMNTHL